ncbi:acetyl-CoA C-acetyltransferase [Saccharospirillum salsuginis]|uniref:Acetyl-CoA acetyltransferase n=1 Tax=Saccharospirillum salsuginis TaxID=418750 RepID=A0A918N6M4_9GAMM|nr:acetyl-CoA C-acetyltransferase [Saccharospirillum salsuginis]GGX44017.1 acetyl-CoA acetyltransferase [Saccharospirillum salsuginis]
MTPDALIYDAIRTPRGRGKPGGALHEIKPIQLVAGLMQRLVERNPMETSAVDDVVLGCVSAIGDQGGDIAKIASLYAGWDTDIAGVTLNRFCASGAEAVNLAAMKVRSGWEDLVVAGGFESMSRVPILSDGGPWALDPETNDRTGFVPQGVGADLIATLAGFDREAVDAFAVASHRKAAAAWDRGGFDQSVVPVVDSNGEAVLARDETVRADCSMAGLSGLKPSFAAMGASGFDDVVRSRYPEVERVEHVHHAGNSSGLADGAALLLVGNETQAKRWGWTPRGRVVSTAVVGSEPTIMLTGPAPAATKALKRAGLSARDIDLWEVNEAFASVVMRFQRELDVDPDRVNVNGGAIAMGHPLGATGAMLIGTVLDELAARNQRYGLVAMCVGGGMGIATIVERLGD